MKKTEMYLLDCIDNLDDYINNNQISIKEYKKGSIIHLEGDLCDSIDIVLKGSLRANDLGENGSELILFNFREGGIIGANLMFSDKEHYPLNIYCVNDSMVANIKKDTLKELLHNYDFVMEYVKSISVNSVIMNRRIKMNSNKSLRVKIIDYLNHESKIQERNPIELSMTKKELADYLGVQRQSLFRELKKMKDEKLIDISNRVIRIN